MTHPFTQAMPTLDNYWRSIVLFGKNTACYKFALAQALLETAKIGAAEVPLNNLAEVFADHVCKHLIKSSIQGTNPTNSYLQTCRDYNLGEVDRSKLIEATNRIGFRYVFDAFHNISGGELPFKFFSIDKKSGQIVLHDEMLELVSLPQAQSLVSEVDSRWSLVESSWRMKLNRNIVTVNYDAEDVGFYENNRQQRSNITSARSALNGYQKGHCFYCFSPISTLSGSSNLADVDHFIPHVMRNSLDGLNVDGVWNLVLACKECNRGTGGKFDKIPDVELLHRLHQRNSYLIHSHHPLRETLISQTGETDAERISFLQDVHSAASINKIITWSPKTVGLSPF